MASLRNLTAERSGSFRLASPPASELWARADDAPSITRAKVAAKVLVKRHPWDAIRANQMRMGNPPKSGVVLDDYVFRLRLSGVTPYCTFLCDQAGGYPELRTRFHYKTRTMSAELGRVGCLRPDSMPAGTLTSPGRPRHKTSLYSTLTRVRSMKAARAGRGGQAAPNARGGGGAFRVPPAALVPLHLVFHAMRQLLDFVGFLDHVHGQHVFVGFVDILFEFGGEFDKAVGIAPDVLLALLVGPLFHLLLDLFALPVAHRGLLERRPGGLLLGAEERQRDEKQNQRHGSGSYDR